MTQVAPSVITRLREAGSTLECYDGVGVRFAAPAPFPDVLLAGARVRRDDIAAVLTAQAQRPVAADAAMSVRGECQETLARP